MNNKNYIGLKISAILDTYLPADGIGTERERLRMDLFSEINCLLNDQASGWQLCPKCNGDGNLLRYNSPSVSSNAAPICDICHGNKLINLSTGLPRE